MESLQSQHQTILVVSMLDNFLPSYVPVSLMVFRRACNIQSLPAPFPPLSLSARYRIQLYPPSGTRPGGSFTSNSARHTTLPDRTIFPLLITRYRAFQAYLPEFRSDMNNKAPRRLTMPPSANMLYHQVLRTERCIEWEGWTGF